MHGIVYPQHLGRALLEEAPAAYRDVDAVVADQHELVTPLLRLRPVLVLKG